MKKLFLALTLTLSAFALNSDFEDYQFAQERMLTAPEAIYLISSFEDSDMITAYSYYGDFLWETPFFAKILSWQIVGERVIIFSKHRSGYKTYLTCLNRFSGKMIWQK